MNTYILRWNPKISSYKKKAHKKLCKESKSEVIFFDWSIYEWENLKIGDTFILCQVGTKKDGIAMIGKFVCSPYKGKSWRKDGTKIHYAKMQIFYALKRKKETILSAKQLEKIFPTIDWHGGHSGVLLDSKIAKELICKIDDELKTLKKFKKTTFSDFIKNDNRYFPVNYLEKKDEILNLIKSYNPIVHTKDAVDYDEWITEFPFLITVESSVSNSRLCVGLESDYLNISFGFWEESFNPYQLYYDMLMERLSGILENKICVLSAYQPKENMKNQKRQSYSWVASIISKKEYTKKSDKNEIFAEFAVMKKDFPNICKIKVQYWDTNRSFTIKL